MAEEITIDAPAQGLGKVTMRRLGRVVALVGRNGAGKSRTLREVAGKLAGEAIYVGPIAGEVKFERAEQLVAEQLDAQVANVRQHVTSFDQARMGWHFLLHQAVRHKFEAEHPRTRAEHPEQLEQWTERFKVLQELFWDVAAVRVTDEYFGEETAPRPFIDGRPVVPADYSEGQRALFAYCARIAEQMEGLRGKTLLLDEPELHLHPAALSTLVQRLRDSKIAQLWLATHSVSLVADLAPSEIWVVKDGTVFPPGAEQVDRVLSELLGDGERIERMRRLCEEPERRAATDFAVQCLTNPSEVAYHRGDAQLTQVAGGCLSRLTLSAASRRLRILDIGAGRGRLPAAFCDRPDLLGRIEYACIQADPGLELHANVEALRRMDSATVASSWIEGSVEAACSDGRWGRFDLVVMCNVLHEVSPTKWWSFFAGVSRLVRHDGALLVLEDLELPVGESAHEYGFVLLHQDAIALLFGSPATEEFVCPEEKYRQRLMAIGVPGSAVEAVTDDSIRAALEASERWNLDRIRSLRNQDSEGSHSRVGRVLALASHSAVNARLACEAVDQPPSRSPKG